MHKLVGRPPLATLIGAGPGSPERMTLKAARARAAAYAVRFARAEDEMRDAAPKAKAA